jgi:tartrate/fumarate subfamily iron-sulfur-dependent hydro-lyase beta chain
MKRINAPFTHTKIKQLNTGDRVLISGVIATGRDQIHKLLYSGTECDLLRNCGAVYHCGPVMINKKSKWQVHAAGPTTSIREEPYMPYIIRNFHLKLIIGKGGMGFNTQQACMKYQCVYIDVIGGAAQLLAKQVKEIMDVRYLEQFGMAEAMWVFKVVDLPGLVTIDTKGKNLHRKIEEESVKIENKLLK